MLSRSDFLAFYPQFSSFTPGIVLDEFLTQANARFSDFDEDTAEVKAGDEMTIRFGDKLGRYQILSVAETARKDAAAQMYRIISEDAGMAEERS